MKHMIPALILAIGASCSAASQENTAGSETFARYCATCHGVEATGNGPMSSVLLLQPPDLTMLSLRNDGVFPTTRVVMRIDGRDPLVSHGSPMPVYGDFFESDQAISLKAESGQPVLTSPPVADLVAFLLSVQQQ